VVEALLVVVISALLFQRSYKPVSRKDEDLTDKVQHLTSWVPILASCFGLRYTSVHVADIRANMPTATVANS